MADLIVSDKPSNKINYKVNKTSNSFFLLPCSSQKLFNLIKKLKNKKAKRTLDIETTFIKYANPVLSVYLIELFNLRVKEGTHPDPLKIAEVITIFRKGDRSKATNCRTISILSQFNKIFEKFLYTRLYSYLIKYNLLIDQQFGSRKNSSSTLAISKLFEELLTNFDYWLYTCSVFLDLCKAFDIVNHAILLRKLDRLFGIREKGLDIFKSYLFNRYQFTQIGSIKSTKRKISCGVPQGSTRGLLHFIFYVNDLSLASQFSTRLFADDTYLALSDTNLSNLEQKVNYLLQLINQWLKRNKLTLNYSKTTYLLLSKQPHVQVCSKFRLHINKSLHERENTVKYLEV